MYSELLQSITHFNNFFCEQSSFQRTFSSGFLPFLVVYPSVMQMDLKIREGIVLCDENPRLTALCFSLLMREVATGGLERLRLVASNFSVQRQSGGERKKRTTSFSGGGEARTADLATMRRALCPLHQMPFGQGWNF